MQSFWYLPYAVRLRAKDVAGRTMVTPLLHIYTMNLNYFQRLQVELRWNEPGCVCGKADHKRLHKLSSDATGLCRL